VDLEIPRNALLGTEIPFSLRIDLADGTSRLSNQVVLAIDDARVVRKARSE
jgi:hypothetical protein